MIKETKELLRVGLNRKYLQKGDETFFWLGDTAWLLFQQCSLKDAYDYLRNRKEKGFNVIQATLIHSLPGEYHSSLSRVKCDVQTKDYWEHCDRVIQMASDMGMYMALLPAWGSIVKQGILNADNVSRYAEFLINRYASYSNIIWILGGDCRGDEHTEVFCRFGELMKAGMPDKLIGFHPFGRTSSSLWFHEKEWLDFNMFQSGHRRYDQVQMGEWDDAANGEYFGEDNWRYVDRDHGYAMIKPTLDGEPSYEQLPQGLHNPEEPYWQACDVRRYAYWSVFQGAMGFTYGSNAIMQFYQDKTVAGNYGVRETWKEALHHEGSGNMLHLKNLMESVDFQNGKPAENLLKSGQGEKYDRISVFASGDYIFCYDYTGKDFILDLSMYSEQRLSVYWMDPSNGVYSFVGETIGKQEFEAKPVKKYTGQNDWVLILRNKERYGV